jgi:nitroreductase
MDALLAIKTRRSVRKYTDQPVPEEWVHELLRAGMQAPSAVNQQPWQFVIIDDHTILDEIPKFHPFSKMLPHAPLAILVCGDESLFKRKERWMQDCSAATENMLIAAHALGLGAVWLGFYPDTQREQKIAELLHLPPTIHPFGMVSLGFPAETPQPEDRFRPDRIHHNHW